MRGLLAMLCAALLIQGGTGFADGLRAYRDGKFDEALAAFSRAEAEAGHAASAELCYDRALAALRASSLRVAESCAEKAAARGGTGFRALRDFILGSSAFERARRARAEAELADADPTALRRAIAQAEVAGAFWKRAAMRATDWPEARRNAERALLLAQDLERMRIEAAKKRRKKIDEKPDRADPAEDEPRRGEEQDPTLQHDPGELARAALARLLARVDAKEREKNALRRARRQAERHRVERDW